MIKNTGIGVGRNCGSDVVKGGMDWCIDTDVLEDVGKCYQDNSVGADNSSIDMWVQDVQNISIGVDGSTHDDPLEDTIDEWAWAIWNFGAGVNQSSMLKGVAGGWVWGDCGAGACMHQSVWVGALRSAAGE